MASNFITTVVAHIDHGKTSMIDSLLALSGAISQTVAGELRYMDSREDEMARGITLKLSSIKLKFRENTFYIIDTPGHVDFEALVQTSSYISDYCALIIDVGEGITPRLFSIVSHIKNKRCVLILNKIDKLFLSDEDFHTRIQNIICQINALFKKEMFVWENNNVILACALYCAGMNFKRLSKIFESSNKKPTLKAGCAFLKFLNDKIKSKSTQALCKKFNIKHCVDKNVWTGILPLSESFYDSVVSVKQESSSEKILSGFSSLSNQSDKMVQNKKHTENNNINCSSKEISSFSNIIKNDLPLETKKDYNSVSFVEQNNEKTIFDSSKVFDEKSFHKSDDFNGSTKKCREITTKGLSNECFSGVKDKSRHENDQNSNKISKYIKNKQNSLNNSNIAPCGLKIGQVKNSKSNISTENLKDSDLKIECNIFEKSQENDCKETGTKFFVNHKIVKSAKKSINLNDLALNQSKMNISPENELNNTINHQKHSTSENNPDYENLEKTGKDQMSYENNIEKLYQQIGKPFDRENRPSDNISGLDLEFFPIDFFQEQNNDGEICEKSIYTKLKAIVGFSVLKSRNKFDENNILYAVRIETGYISQNQTVLCANENECRTIIIEEIFDCYGDYFESKKSAGPNELVFVKSNFLKNSILTSDKNINFKWPIQTKPFFQSNIICEDSLMKNKMKDCIKIIAILEPIFKAKMNKFGEFEIFCEGKVQFEKICTDLIQAGIVFQITKPKYKWTEGCNEKAVFFEKETDLTLKIEIKPVEIVIQDSFSQDIDSNSENFKEESVSKITDISDQNQEQQRFDSDHHENRSCNIPKDKKKVDKSEDFSLIYLYPEKHIYEKSRKSDYSNILSMKTDIYTNPNSDQAIITEKQFDNIPSTRNSEEISLSNKKSINRSGNVYSEESDFVNNENFLNSRSISILENHKDHSESQHTEEDSGPIKISNPYKHFKNYEEVSIFCEGKECLDSIEFISKNTTKKIIDQIQSAHDQEKDSYKNLYEFKKEKYIRPDSPDEQEEYDYYPQKMFNIYRNPNSNDSLIERGTQATDILTKNRKKIFQKIDVNFDIHQPKEKKTLIHKKEVYTQNIKFLESKENSTQILSKNTTNFENSSKSESDDDFILENLTLNDSKNESKMFSIDNIEDSEYKLHEIIKHKDNRLEIYTNSYMNAIKNAYNTFISSGCVSGNQVTLTDLKMHFTSSNSFSEDDIFKIIKDSLYDVYKRSQPSLFPFYYSCKIQLMKEYLGIIYPLLQKYKQIFIDDTYDENTDFHSIRTLMPQFLYYQFLEESRKQTNGTIYIQIKEHGFIRTTDFNDHIDNLRKEKGMLVNEILVENPEKQRTLKK